MRLKLILAVLLSGAPAALAQTPPDAAAGGQPPPHERFMDKFDEANTTHDGKLTLDQAQAAGMKGIARHFSEIDAGNKGYVTLQDVRDWAKARRAARQPPAQEAQPAPPPQ
jgi:hypothetical protein